MNNSFKEFMNTNKFTEEEKKELQHDAENLVRKYASMSQNELASALFNEVAKQKANGTFDKDKLYFMLESIKNMLPSNAYESIHSAIKTL